MVVQIGQNALASHTSTEKELLLQHKKEYDKVK
jgi:hypothetical protein